MLVLAIDTSARHFSVALLNDDQLMSSFNSKSEPADVPIQSVESGASKGFPPGVSVKLFPAFNKLLRDADCRLGDVQLIAVATGPGLFTGLRVGVVTAKTLAYVNQIPLVGVNTLEVIAAQSARRSESTIDLIKPVLNAQRQQLFAGIYRVHQSGNVQEIEPNLILDRKCWLEQLGEGEMVTGTGLKPLLADLTGLPSFLNQKLRLAPESTWESSAEHVGRVGLSHFLDGRQDDLWTLEPFYFRPSTAEERFGKK